MKKYTTIVSSILLVFAMSSFTMRQDKIGKNLKTELEKPGQTVLTVWVYLSDKGPDADAKLFNPMSFITQRSFERRLKVKSIMNAVDITDVPVYDNYVSQLSNDVMKIRHKSKWLNAVSVEAGKEQINELAEFGFVRHIELVERFKLNANETETASNAPEINSGEFLPEGVLADSINYGTGNAVTQITQIKVNSVHNDGIFGQGILVCDLDAGFSNLTHEAFTTYPMNIISTYDFQNHTPVLPGHSHGTGTLSLIGGYKPGKLVSPAFAADFMLGRTEVATSETPSEMDNWIAGAEWADSLGADVISSSLGYLDFDAPYTSFTWSDMNGRTMPITNIADLAVNKGIVVCNSAGNNGSTTHNTLIGPADGDSVITVGAVTSSGTRASFSSIGPTTDVPARIKPDIMAMGSSDYMASTSGNTYTSASGTSFSCPLTSGVCALMLCANKNLTPIQIRDILRKFGNNTSSPNNNNGWGILDAKKSVDTARKLDIAPPVISYTHQLTTVNHSGPVTIRCSIKDNGIIRNRVNEAPNVYYRKNVNNVWSSFTRLNYSSCTKDKYIFTIPGGEQKATVEFYFAAQDIALPNPLVSTLPSGGSGINPPGSNPPVQRFSYKVSSTGGTFADNNHNGIEINCYPNPFNPSTKISYNLSADSKVEMKIYNTLGKEISVPVNEIQSEGYHSVNFDAGNFPAGVYFYRINLYDELTGEKYFSEVRKMLLVK